MDQSFLLTLSCNPLLFLSGLCSLGSWAEFLAALFVDVTVAELMVSRFPPCPAPVCHSGQAHGVLAILFLLASGVRHSASHFLFWNRDRSCHLWVQLTTELILFYICCPVEPSIISGKHITFNIGIHQFSWSPSFISAIFPQIPPSSWLQPQHKVCLGLKSILPAAGGVWCLYYYYYLLLLF